MASKEVCCIENIPDIEDVNCIERIFKSLGCNIKREKNSITIDSREISSLNANTEDVRKMRASYYFLGALLGRFKRQELNFQVDAL